MKLQISVAILATVAGCGSTEADSARFDESKVVGRSGSVVKDSAPSSIPESREAIPRSEISSEHLVSLLGRPFDESLKGELAAKLGPLPELDEDESTLDRGYLEFLRIGVSIIFTRDEHSPDDPLALDGFFFYPSGMDGYSQFKGALPYGVKFGEPRATVRAKIPVPYTSGGGQWNDLVKRKLHEWDRFDFERHYVHCQFGDTGLLDLVTVGRRDRPASLE